MLTSPLLTTRRLAISWVCAASLIAACSVSNARAGCRDDIAGARHIGAGEFCVLGFCLYRAELWAPKAPVAPLAPLSFDIPFALSLTYERSLSGARIVSTGIDEIQRLATQPIADATLSAWRDAMRRAFGDVSRGDELCGVYLPGRGARFYLNGNVSAEIDDPAFAQAFFGIWLDPRTRAPSLRKQLLGSN
ncbi:chalcone isomerase family protein [Pandoraea sp. PE-S2T-3]|uniref:chalcone isomerase family protein n=1 Tax=Pandoraea sp. PE-S2T-3 TaxID=1986993 RepID=UPI003F9039CB